ncbi:uncharacterized protein LOC130689828 isoform X2 [Daphnia carinata]|uniref:uncharacterized protein LOC130689828 isoform X2 n=1 Tax=Daphnia carinata TaxID=120202 RepID=UPI0028685889|nr:uncharacterized protein LOC130689828 isoform X2 [Daphnia carinata]
MSTFCILFSVLLMLQVSRACDGNNEEDQLGSARQQSDDYYANAYGFSPESWNALYYQSSGVPITEYPGQYEGRTTLSSGQPISVNPFAKYFANSNTGEEVNPAEGRFAFGNLGTNLINTGIFNNRFTPANTFRPFQNFGNRVPLIVNPNFNNPISGFDDCTSPSGDSGICVPGKVCSLFGGRPSGSCVLGKVCCINAITTCGGTVTLNNTFWQSPTTSVSVPSTCALTVRMNSKLAEQLKKPICQIRLDFVSFTTAQPTLGTCTDTFQVGGSTSTVPTICGDNSGQHMYLDVPSSATTPSDVQLVFNFGTATATRSWNIKIAMLPCGASYLAPAGCLQYYTASSGKVKSFNWQDVTTTAIRQLNNQNYNICFRTELLSGQRATEVCLSACTVTSGDAFSITTPTSTAAATAANAVATATTAVAVAQANVAAATAATLAAATAALTAAQAALATAQATAATAAAAAALLSGVGTSAVVNGVTTATCMYDFLLIGGGRDAAGIAADRYCGNALNPASAGSATSVQVCTPIKSFKMNYRTDSTEAAVAAATNVLPAPADTLNVGFCLDYQEK